MTVTHTVGYSVYIKPTVQWTSIYDQLLCVDAVRDCGQSVLLRSLQIHFVGVLVS